MHHCSKDFKRGFGNNATSACYKSIQRLELCHHELDYSAAMLNDIAYRIYLVAISNILTHKMHAPICAPPCSMPNTHKTFVSI